MAKTTNIFDYFEQVEDHQARSVAGAGAPRAGGRAPAAQAGPSAPWAARAPRRPSPRYDLTLTPREPAWQQDAESLAVLEQLQAEPWVDSIERRDDRVNVRLDDRWIETVGATLEAGGGAEAALSDLARAQRFAVQFWDPNATKALHVGHLRNLAIGNALAAALAQAGGDVERRSLISDAGRSMGEAMAGIVKSGRHAQSWPDGGLKSDHFVGVCYADYVADSNGFYAGQDAEEPGDSLSRELLVRDDAADELLKRVMQGDSEALELWFKTRAWVISGQRTTLARLGIPFDRVFFESDFLEDGSRLTEAGLREGRLQRREDGVIVYLTDVQDLQEMPLVRPDGVTTQHMRAVSYWLMAPDLDDVISLQVCGTEWVSHAVCINKLMSELKPLKPSGNGHGVHPMHDIFHGMVSKQKRAVASSAEGALLIDDLIEALEKQIGSDPQMRDVRRAHPAPERIPAQIVLGWFLPYPAVPPIDFDAEKLLREGESLGWDLVRARACQGGRESSAGHRPAEDPDYRFAVVQSELYRRHLRLAVERFDVMSLALYLRHLARWYLEGGRSGAVERVVHTLLDRSARGLGLEAGR
jgi:arginyl-tRNA synthetase